jgi:hypothetical protein
MGIYPQEITNDMDVIDSREVAHRIEHLVREQEIADDPDDPAPDYMTDDERAELVALRAFVKQALVGGSERDWEQADATLIRESHFAEYLKTEFFDAAGAPGNDQWPYSHIDWDSAADEESANYTALDFGGVTYYTADHSL